MLFVSPIPKTKLFCLLLFKFCILVFQDDALVIYNSSIVSPCHFPCVIVPNVCIVFVPVHVDNPIFSTLFKFKSALTSL